MFPVPYTRMSISGPPSTRKVSSKPIIFCYCSRGHVLHWIFILAENKTAHHSRTPRSYGKVETLRASETTMVGSGLIFRRGGRTNAAPCLTAKMGLLGLEVQASMYKFLPRCVTMIGRHRRLKVCSRASSATHLSSTANFEKDRFPHVAGPCFRAAISCPKSSTSIA